MKKTWSDMYIEMI